MSEIKYCPRGGMDGVFVTRKELVEFAKKMGKKCIDEIIPLPKDFNQIAKKDCPYRKDEHGNEDVTNHSLYWETDTGGHGWCCEMCGTVFQWG